MWNCKFLLKIGGDRLLRMVMNDGSTALHEACRQGHLPVLQCLLARTDTALLQHRQKSGCTCLHVATDAGHAGAVRTLISAPGGEELALLGKETGCTAIFFACHHGHLEMVKLLLAVPGGAEMAAWRGSPGTSCLEVAATGGHADVIEELLSATVPLMLEVNGPGHPWPMFQACQRGHLAAVEVLARLDGETMLFGTVDGGMSCLVFSMLLRRLDMFKLVDGEEEYLEVLVAELREAGIDWCEGSKPSADDQSSPDDQSSTDDQFSTDDQ